MAEVKELIAKVREYWRPPKRLKLSEWSDEHAFLSAESAAEAGKWRTLPYQKGMMDAMTDPAIERVTVIKSARVGYTKIINNLVGYHIHQDPCSIMVVQPAIDDAEGYSKEEIAPMLRDTPCLQGLVSEAKSKDSNNTILSKSFPGGTLGIVGANSPRGFRRVSRRIVIFDEVDGYPLGGAGDEGDQIKLGIRRTEYYWNRKIVAGSTPLLEKTSRIKSMWNESDQRRYFVPCPHCDEYQYLKWSNIKWPKGDPDKAYYECEHCRKAIEHSQKRWMVERGEWRATAVGSPGHAGFHIWAAYSYSPNSTWANLAREFLECKDKPKEFQTWVNTVLGETWEEKGDAPEWEVLYRRREKYPFNKVPEGAYFLTAGADVQADRIEVEIVGWGRNLETWSIDYRVFPGSTSTYAPWDRLKNMLAETFESHSGVPMGIRMLAVDSGYNTQFVYNWVRQFAPNRVIAVKGMPNLSTMYGQPKKVDIDFEGKKIQNGLLLWGAGGDVAKSEIYGFLKQQSPLNAGDPFPPGYCHFPEYGEEFFKMLTAESLVLKRNKKGFSHYEWEASGRNEALDCRVYNRVAAAILGIDRLPDEHWEKLKIVQVPPITTITSAQKKPREERRRRRDSDFL